MKKFTKITALVLSIVLVAAIFVACGSKDNNATTAAGENETEAKTVKFATNAEFPPFEFVAANGVIGEYDGIDIAIAKQLGEKCGFTPEIVNMEFDSELVALKNGQVDACISGMTIADDRKESVDFSIPYYTATQVMIVKEGSDIKTAADMEGKKIVVIQGYTGETAVQKLGYEFESFKKGTEAVLELVNGKCDVVVIDSATAEAYIGDNEGLAIIHDDATFGVEEYGIAVAKGNTELLNQINAELQKMLDDGTIDKLATQYTEAQ